MKVNEALHIIGIELLSFDIDLKYNKSRKPSERTHTRTFPIDDLFRFVYYTLVAYCNKKLKIPSRRDIALDSSHFCINLIDGKNKYTIWFACGVTTEYLGIMLDNKPWYLLKDSTMLVVVRKVVKMLSRLRTDKKHTKVYRKGSTVWLKSIDSEKTIS